ncbi:MAG TPA: hypothetical protein PKC39_13005 [Ferruginibacter sp.]|nr:hypothetical protein [Ferruginibacter sp.]HMP21871.1 hypothetical protein [Ferruginibacter sp.]
MTNTSSADMLNFDDGNKPALPGALNVLTILTFIGCALGFGGSIWNYVRAEKAYKDIQEAQSKMEDAPAWAKKLMGPEMLEMARKSLENKLPMLVLGLLGTGLCLYGAMEMRKLKKQGFPLWVAGEFLPIIGGVIFLGTGMFSGFAIFSLVFPLIFLALYAMQRKHLIH